MVLVENPLSGDQGMVWNGMEDDFSIFHTKISSIFHSILPYQGKFRPQETRNLYFTKSFATLSVLLQVVAQEGKHQAVWCNISQLVFEALLQ